MQPGNKKISMSILKKYQPESVEDMQSVFKEIFGLMFENMFKGEMNYHLGFFEILFRNFCDPSYIVVGKNKSRCSK